MYRPAYIKLSEALNHVIEAGLSEQEAKAQILHAVGDEEVGIFTTPTRHTLKTFNVAHLIRDSLSMSIDVDHIVDWESSLAEADPTNSLIELKRADVERFWPKIPTSQSSRDEGRYVPPFIGVMFEAIDHFELDGEKVVKTADLVDWFKGKQVEGEVISASLARYMATLVREPRLMHGGNKKPKKDTG